MIIRVIETREGRSQRERGAERGGDEELKGERRERERIFGEDLANRPVSRHLSRYRLELYHFRMTYSSLT